MSNILWQINQRVTTITNVKYSDEQTTLDTIAFGYDYSFKISQIDGKTIVGIYHPSDDDERFPMYTSKPIHEVEVKAESEFPAMVIAEHLCTCLDGFLDYEYALTESEQIVDVIKYMAQENGWGDLIITPFKGCLEVILA